MRECAIVRDLLPLYLDDALSPESRQMVDEHLSGCDGCRQALNALQVRPLPDVFTEKAAPSEDARFLIKLKRQAGTVLGLILVAIVATALIAGRVGSWREAREQARLRQQIRAEQTAAVAAIRLASPDPLARLTANGVKLDASATRTGAAIDVWYTLKAAPPAAQAGTFDTADAPPSTLFDPVSGQDIGRFVSGGSSMNADGIGEGNAQFDGVAATQAQVGFQMPMVAVYFDPDESLRWDVTRPGEKGDVSIGENIHVGGVDFAVDRLSFDGEHVRVDYHQLTPAAEVGVHYLIFRLSDRMGNWWGGDYSLSQLTDPAHPYQQLDYVRTFSKTLTLSVERAILVVPGPVLTMEVK